MHEWIYDTVALSVITLSFIILFHKRVRTSETWRATVTPLASIIGSGFLVSAPLLLFSTGHWAGLVMLGIVIVAYAVGYSIRFNIHYIEKTLRSNNCPVWIKRIDAFSHPALGLAYVISVTFYLKLLSAFAMRLFDITDDVYENLLTTGILLVIGITGKLKGLSMLELIETYSVNTKLAIIFALIVTFSMYNLELWHANDWSVVIHPKETLWQGIRKVLGLLIIVQGFETSRYLGEAHDEQMRIKTMKYAQWLSGVIYVVFVSVSAVLFHHHQQISETAIIDLSEIVARLLPFLLVIAAVMSQFSAAISDTLGGGGLLAEACRNKVSSKDFYLIITLLGIGLTWLTDIYSIISIASKAFAFYYAIQILLSLTYLHIHDGQISHHRAKLILFWSIFILMMMVLFLGVPLA